ncbi:MAG: hypothetical protein KKG59_07370 [Nanoarchaeota archaeon]|nr:hypothetical protein [Nanoarchaeota archaeon]
MDLKTRLEKIEASTRGRISSAYAAERTAKDTAVSRELERQSRGFEKLDRGWREIRRRPTLQQTLSYMLAPSNMDRESFPARVREHIDERRKDVPDVLIELTAKAYVLIDTQPMVLLPISEKQAKQGLGKVVDDALSDSGLKVQRFDYKGFVGYQVQNMNAGDAMIKLQAAIGNALPTNFAPLDFQVIDAKNLDIQLQAPEYHIGIQQMLDRLKVTRSRLYGSINAVGLGTHFDGQRRVFSEEDATQLGEYFEGQPTRTSWNEMGAVAERLQTTKGIARYHANLGHMGRRQKKSGRILVTDRGIEQFQKEFYCANGVYHRRPIKRQ